MNFRYRVIQNVASILLVSFFTSHLSAQTSDKIGAGDVAKHFLEKVILGESFYAKSLITNEDRNRKYPFGELTPIVKLQPIFPSLWDAKVISVDIDGDEAEVHISIAFPEIEILAAKRYGAINIDQAFLDSYRDKDVPMSSRDFSVDLVLDEEGSWSVSTGSERYEWNREKLRFLSPNSSSPSLAEATALRDDLLKRFPTHADEIENLVNPMLATATVAANAVFTDVTIDPDNPKWIQGTYDVAFTFANPTEYTVEYLKVLIILRDAQGLIVERDDLLVFYSGSLPQGLRPGERVRERHPLSAQNPEIDAVLAEISILEVRAR